ncbi:MAG: protein translocase SEC61 complex subunit gamma [archaeon]
MFPKLKTFINECVRVLRITKKPEPDEFKNIVKVSGLGILLIGTIGFLIQLIKTLIS